MASYRFITLAILLIFVPAMAMAAEHIVGGDAGWTVGYNYTYWAENQVFYVGDTLVFNYKPPIHNVIKVNGTEFHECKASKLDAPPLTSGHDVITLAGPGKKWYICGKITDNTTHCSLGQKLVINVMNTSAPTSAPTWSPTWSPKPSDNTTSFGIMSSSSSSPVIMVVAAVVLMAMIMV